MTKDELAKMAEETKELVKQGYYLMDPPGNYRDEVDWEIRAGEWEVNIRQRIGPMSALIHPEDWEDMERVASDRPPEHAVKPNVLPPYVTVEDLTTVQAAGRISQYAREDTSRTRCAGVMILNFASGRSPGGGWLRGTEAQEESLARVSDLVSSLERWPRYYRLNRDSDVLYTDHAIWSPNVVFFRDEDGTLLHRPWHANVLTIPAPNLSAATGELRVAAEVVLRRRISHILTAAAFYHQHYLVLGAWGCGVFANDPVLVARLFKEGLLRWNGYFECVVFAIHDTSKDQRVLNQFQEAFA